MAQHSDGCDAPPVARSGAESAAIALWCGVSALICGAAAPCCCYLTWLPALPLSVAALWFGVQAQSVPALTRSESTSATAALVSGGFALVLSLVFMALFVLYAVYAAVLVGSLGSMRF